MTDSQPACHALHPRPFEDGQALTYTLREIYDATGEFQSQHHDLGAAAHAFTTACEKARCVELRDTDGSVIAGYVRGRAAQDRHAQSDVPA